MLTGAEWLEFWLPTMPRTRRRDSTKQQHAAHSFQMCVFLSVTSTILSARWKSAQRVCLKWDPFPVTIVVLSLLFRIHLESVSSQYSGPRKSMKTLLRRSDYFRYEITKISKCGEVIFIHASQTSWHTIGADMLRILRPAASFFLPSASFTYI